MARGPSPAAKRPAADAMYALLVLRADIPASRTQSCDEAVELQLMADAAEVYEAKRWPNGKVSGGKG